MIQRPKMLEDHIDSHLIEKQEFPDEIMRIITGLCFACCMVLTAMCLFISFNRLNANKRKGQIIKFNKSQAKVEIHSDEDAMITEEQRKSPIIKVKKYQTNISKNATQDSMHTVPSNANGRKNHAIKFNVSQTKISIDSNEEARKPV